MVAMLVNLMWKWVGYKIIGKNSDFIIINHRIQMHKHKYYKPPKPSTLPQKPIDLDSRPQFVTDFSDPDKYKLSESEMIQKKAALQSKNRQAARQSLQERKRKLEMGIIDQDTRPIYQTALTSKKIDLNPSIRRNLSQMIQYQREKSASKNRGSASKNRKQNNQNQNSQEEDNNQGFEGQIKKTQHFIKKLEKAKKQQNIGRAVDILLNDKKSSNFGPSKYNQSSQEQGSKSQQLGKSTSESGLNQISSSRMSGMSQQQTLSNIEETIKFMQQKLFNPNWKKNKPQKPSTSTTTQQKPLKTQQKLQDMKCSTISNISYNQFLSSFPSARQSPQTIIPQYASPISNYQQKNQTQQSSFDMQAQLTALRLNFNKNTNINLINGKNNSNNIINHHNSSDQQQEEDECLSTIRRMKQMMQGKANLYDNTQCSKQKQNKNVLFNQNYQSQRSHQTYKSDGDAQVDFSLTLNQDEIQQHNYQSNHSHSHSQQQKKQKPTQHNQPYQQYQQTQPVQTTKPNFQTQMKQYEDLKRSLFEEIDQLQEKNNMNNIHKLLEDDEEQEEQSYHIPSPIPVQYQFSKQPIKVNPVKNSTNIPTNMPKKNNYYQQQWQQPKLTTTTTTELPIPKVQNFTRNPQPSISTVNKQLQNLKNIVHGAKQNVSKIGVQKIGIDEGIRGFDYRGSINIKKHIMNQ